MILKRIRTINNVGQFFKATMNKPIDKDFTKMSLVYGLNGFGKSTLAEVIRSLKENNSSLVMSKRSLPEKGEPAVTFSFAPDFANTGKETVVTCSAAGWKNAVDNLEIFDCKFISENVYSDFEITHEHKKKISALILGDEGVVIAKKIEDVQKEIDEAKKEQKITVGKITVLKPKGYTGSLSDFRSIATTEKLKIKTKAALQSSLKTVIEADMVQKLASPVPLTSSIDIVTKELPNLEKILALSESTISSEVAEKVQKHIAENLDERGEAWLLKGMEYHEKNKKCSFCTQDTNAHQGAKDMIAAYGKFFSKEYETFIETVQSGTHSAKSSIAGQMMYLSDLEGVFERNSSRYSKIKDYIGEAKYTAKLAVLTSAEDAVKAQAEDLLTHLKPIKADADKKILDKTQKPLTVVKLNTYDGVELLKKETQLNTALTTYNEVMSEITVMIAELKKATTTGKQVEIEKDLLHIGVVEARFDPAMLRLVKSIEDSEASILLLEKQKTDKEAELISHNEVVAEKYLKEANDVLKACGCRFTIRVPDDFSRKGLRPVIDLGFELLGSSIDGKKFGEILSESDKRCLAFALFIARMNTYGEKLKEKIIVLDDPFTSLDDNRQDSTILQIKKLESKSAQVLVLCHYSQPMGELAKDFKGSLQIEITNDPTNGSIFIERDLVGLRNNKHHCNLDQLQNVLDTTVPSTQFPSVRLIIRNVVEYEILSRFRPNFIAGTETTLGDIITKLEAEVAAGNATLKGNPVDVIFNLRHINSKTAGEHHGDPSGTDNTDNIENLRTIIRTATDVIYNQL